jgi:hypothetical protein
MGTTTRRIENRGVAVSRTFAIRLFVTCALFALPWAAAAQSWGPLTLEELKQEAQRRAERNLPPLSGVNPEDAREALT